jgi:LacI family transcriptional regulator
MRLPTQRELAKKLGLSQACISKALRDLPGISEQTRLRVLDAASALGYRPDPVLSALVSRRRSGPPSVAIGYIRNRVEGNPPYSDPYYPVVARRCAAIGLTLYLIEADQDHASVQRQLDHRHIAGVIVGQSLTASLQLAWDRIRAVHCGMMVPPERGDVVCPDTSSAVETAWRHMTALGYERIAALLFTSDCASHSEQLLTGSLLALERRIGDRGRFRAWIGAREQRDEAVECIRQQQPEATLLYWGDIAGELRQRGVDLPCAALIANQEFAGMEIPYEEIAVAAVDLLVQRLRSSPGSTWSRRIHLIGMQWHDGPSLPDRRPELVADQPQVIKTIPPRGSSKP